MVIRPLRALIDIADKLGMNVGLNELKHPARVKVEQEGSPAETDEVEVVEKVTLKLEISYGGVSMAGGTFATDEDFNAEREHNFSTEELICAGIASNLYRSYLTEWKKKQK